ncbi:MAG: ABC-F family ATP-binding cassette domain-containing protein, partial [Chloroflexi bacterium]|nr:ABC-F family ATP-binding cassette domain-containing protein [Chloroflexota bacterium]
YLGRYLFSGEEVFKKVDVLSGGERGRLALAKLALQDTNLLLLDEPTNHLDIPSQEILEAVLDQYSGTILLVTHDRYLIDALATQVWEIDPQETTLDVFEGSYSLRRAERERLAALRLGAENSQPGTSPRRSAPRRAAGDDARVERRRVARLQELENRIAALEGELSQIGFRLEKPPLEAGRVAELGREYARVQSEMDSLLAEWEQLQD